MELEVEFDKYGAKARLRGEWGAGFEWRLVKEVDR